MYFVHTCGVPGSVAFLCTGKRQVIHACGSEVRLRQLYCTSSQAAYPEQYSGWTGGRGFQAWNDGETGSLGGQLGMTCSKHEFQPFQAGPMSNPNCAT